MEIKRIIVDDISGGRGVNKVLADVVIIFTVGNTISQATKKNCLVEIEEECVWEEDDEFIHNHWTGCNTLIYGVGYKFCPNCGKRIRYEEE